MSLIFFNFRNIVAIIPNINFVAVASIINLIKGKYIICDVNKNTGMIDKHSFLEALDFCKLKKIKPNIFIPIHYAGNIANLNEIKNSN